MKKFFFFVIALSLSLNFTLANDLLFKASNGRLSENSVGVKKLSDAEMSEVKGGFYAQAYKHNIYFTPQGHKIYARYYAITLNEDQKRMGAIYEFNDGINPSHHYSTFLTFARHGIPTIQISYNYDTGGFAMDFGVVTSDQRIYYNKEDFAIKLQQYFRKDGQIINDADKNLYLGKQMFRDRYGVRF